MIHCWAQMKVEDSILDFGTCFIRSAYSRPCTLLNTSPVLGEFEVKLQDEESMTKAILATTPSQGVLSANSAITLEYSIRTMSLGEIAFTTGIIAVPGSKQTVLPIQVQAMSIGLF